LGFLTSCILEKPDEFFPQKMRTMFYEIGLTGQIPLPKSTGDILIISSL